MSKNKTEAIAISNDPNTIMSYGILIDNLMYHTRDKFFWHLISEEYQYGIPESRGHFIKWCSGKTPIERDNVMLPKVIRKVQPELQLNQEYYNKSMPSKHGDIKICEETLI